VQAPDKGILGALGGYHATLMFREIADSADGTMFDFLIRGEGERVFHELLLALKNPSESVASIKGLPTTRRTVSITTRQHRLPIWSRRSCRPAAIESPSTA
jgi:radical SAM superfamily enzyme YgiQ (UPF0313 family)